MLRRRKQACSQWVVRNTRAHGVPMTSFRSHPVIRSAARLNEVIRPSWSTVKIPSGMLSKMIEPMRGSTSMGRLPAPVYARSVTLVEHAS
jgi:hypothetical protein